jgi:hypothetical protein
VGTGNACLHEAEKNDEKNAEKIMDKVLTGCARKG